MKKFILSLSILSSFIVANPLEFKTLSSNFKQSVTSEEAKIEYAGNFIATRTNAFWHYESPNLKDIYFSFDRVVVIEPDLEQAIITTIKNTPNLTEILANAKPNKNGIYEAKFDDVTYQIELKNELPHTIKYTDKLDNKVEITLSGTQKDQKVNEALLIPEIPKNFDIISQ